MTMVLIFTVKDCKAYAGHAIARNTIFKSWHLVYPNSLFQTAVKNTLFPKTASMLLPFRAPICLKQIKININYYFYKNNSNYRIKTPKIFILKLQISKSSMPQYAKPQKSLPL